MGFLYLTRVGPHLVLDRVGFAPHFEALPFSRPVLVSPIGHPQFAFLLHVLLLGVPFWLSPFF
jgi:hypothetical protein